MKRFSVAIGILLGLLFSIVPGPARMGETNKWVGLSVIEAAAADCPNCSGTAVEVKDTTFYNDTVCTCVGSQSITVGPGVTVQSRATVTFKAPTVVIGTGNTFQPGAIIHVLQVQVGSITLTATPNSVAAGATNYSTIKVEVKDTSKQPVPKGTAVTLITTRGTFSNGSATSTITMPDNTGVTTTFLFVGTTQGTATVTATAGGVTAQVTVTVTAPTTDPATITIEAVPSTLVADGSSTSTITATVLDGTGAAVKNGTVITFTKQYGTLSSATATTTNGKATVTYTAPSVKPDGGSDTITATAPNGVYKSTSVTISGPTVATVVLSANPTSIPANGTSTSTISATVTVQGGSSAPAGILVIFSIKSGGGSLPDPPEATTNANGIATIQLTSASSPGTASLGAIAGGISAQPIEVKFEAGSLTVSIVPNSVLATGEEECKVTILAKYADGEPIKSQPIDLVLSDATMGSLDDSQPTTNDNGEATAWFTAGTKGGTVTITATWDSGGTDVTGTGTITIQPPPAFIQIVTGYPNPQKINIKGTGGQATSEIKFLVKDSQGNLVDSGYRIDFSIITGPNGGENLIPSSTKTTSGGVASLLYSGFKSGPVSIRATYHHDTSISTTSSQVVIVGGPAVGEEFGISAKYVNVSGIYLAGLHDTLTANAADTYGNAIADNTAIAFKTYNTGGFFATGTAVTTNGVASDDLVSGGTYLSPINGFVSATAEVVGGNTTRVSCIAVTPGYENIIYAGTNGGGVYKSMDSGATWQNISRSSENPKRAQNWIDPYIKGNSAICVDQDNPDTVYVGTGYLGRGHVYKSLDGGMNWNSNDVEQWNGIFSTYSQNAAILTVLADGDDDPLTAPWPYVWVGTEGQGAWYSTDEGETFTQSTGLGYGKTVTEIVRVPDSHGGGAILYAATPTGVFKSINGGVSWAETTLTFSNDIINTLILHPKSNGAAAHYLYVGTENAGVWFSKDGGAAQPWTQYYPNGMGEGLSATVPVPNVNNEGNGTMSDVTVGSKAQSEFWTLTYDGTAPAGFAVEGSVSGVQPGKAFVDTEYILADVLTFTIYGGSIEFVDDINRSDSFTFTTTRDPARTIKDLLVDEKNSKLYALTYFFGPLEPYHAVGNCYMIGIDTAANGYAPTGTWTEANSGLPQYSPPKDATLFPQYALATDDPSDPAWFLIGGEGINMYKATSGFNTVAGPDWKVSKSGLSNLIMARMPILFSGACTMAVTPTFFSATGTWQAGISNNGDGTMSAVITSSNTKPEEWTVIFNGTDWDVNGSVSGAQTTQATTGTPYSSDNTEITFTITAGSTPFQSGDRFTIICSVTNLYSVYIQDINGNPPISGSKFTVTTYDYLGVMIKTVLEQTYSDSYNHIGTWSDPEDSTTNNPYEVYITFKGGNWGVTDPFTAEFKFEPECKSVAPGCSGSSQTASFSAID